MAMAKVFGIFVKTGFGDRNSHNGQLLHLFVAKDSASIEMSKLEKNYPDHYFYMKTIDLCDS